MMKSMSQMSYAQWLETTRRKRNRDTLSFPVIFMAAAVVVVSVVFLGLLLAGI